LGTWELAESLLVEDTNLRAGELGDGALQSVGEEVELVAVAGLGSLQEEAGKVVALEKVGAVDHTTREIGQVDTSKTVYGSGTIGKG
jgi:hypothetical protein